MGQVQAEGGPEGPQWILGFCKGNCAVNKPTANQAARSQPKFACQSCEVIFNTIPNPSP